MQQPPVFQSVSSIARLAGCTRNLVYRLLATGELKADAYIAEGAVALPVFLPERAVDVVRGQRRASKNPNFCSELSSRKPGDV